MKGRTHLGIGCAIGVAAAAYYPFTWQNATLYIAVSAFSALSADLDGPSLLTSKLGKVSKLLRELGLWIGALMVTGIIYLYANNYEVPPGLSLCAIAVMLLGIVARDGFIRNVLACLAGCVVVYFGYREQMDWLLLLGLFIAIAPWLKHRGMTHTIWAVILWGYIGSGLEGYLQLEGIMWTAIAGYVSHLAADTVTPRGVKWLFPLYKKSIRLPF
ncbi:metal-dependent hydrolase [Paenibacillus sp. ACRRX]|uniref:metal-dependent hydrolase n=1 Tax=unclassified Paenibacillus TaxID=185978 RepID=UPI001EF40773|nr:MULTISPECIES: metal-dependent hydrolase [unclassified Paenibacillus]MCG7407244.1 metal-dependent hydrolase [Paenibacillus sp. ACRRX]MDK8180463.1 metal-dependent hydrolase [Paenibacillus sp. UMB4589-SE434]